MKVKLNERVKTRSLRNEGCGTRLVPLVVNTEVVNWFERPSAAVRETKRAQDR